MSEQARRAALEVREFCDKYRICRDVFYKQVRTGRLIASKIGTKTIVWPENEDAWVASLPELELPAAS